MSQDLEKDVPVENGPESQLRARSNEESSLEQAIQPDPAKPPYNPFADPSSFPDGGREAWLTVLGAFCCLFNSWGCVSHRSRRPRLF